MPDFPPMPDQQTVPQPDKRPQASEQHPVPGSAQPIQEDAEAAHRENREYDRRGILLPARARVGGIITPQ